MSDLLTIAGILFAILATFIWINPAWSFWLSEPFYAPLRWVYDSHNDHWRGGPRFHMLMGQIFKKLQWLRLSDPYGSFEGTGPTANRKRQILMLVLYLISGLLFIAGALID